MATPDCKRVGRAAKSNGLAADDDSTLVGRVNPRQQLPERALSGAVLAAERVAGSRGDLERDVVERDDAGKAFRDAVEANCSHRGCHLTPGRISSARFFEEVCPSLANADPVTVADPALAANGQPPSGRRATARPNIVFILIDDLRWDELGFAGHPFVKTPNIDRIGKRRRDVSQRVHHDAALLAFAGQLSDRAICAHPRDHRQRRPLRRESQARDLSAAAAPGGLRNGLHRQVAHGQRRHAAPGFRSLGQLQRTGDYLDPEINEDGKAVKPSATSPTFSTASASSSSSGGTTSRFWSISHTRRSIPR